MIVRTRSSISRLSLRRPSFVLVLFLLSPTISLRYKSEDPSADIALVIPSQSLYGDVGVT